MAGSSRIYQWGPFANFSALALITTAQNGDQANIVMSGQTTSWYYDSTLAVWRISSPFFTTDAILQADTALPGVQNGDWATAVDTGRKAYWDGPHSVWSFVS